MCVRFANHIIYIYRKKIIMWLYIYMLYVYYTYMICVIIYTYSMYVCMYIFYFSNSIYEYLHIHIYIYAYIKLYVYTCVRVYTFIYAHILGVKYMWCMSINMLFWSLLYFYRSSIFFCSSPSSSGSFVFGSDLFIKQAACQGSLCTQCTPS